EDGYPDHRREVQLVLAGGHGGRPEGGGPDDGHARPGGRDGEEQQQVLPPRASQASDHGALSGDDRADASCDKPETKEEAPHDDHLVGVAVDRRVAASYPVSSNHHASTSASICQSPLNAYAHVPETRPCRGRVAAWQRAMNGLRRPGSTRGPQTRPR